MPLLVACFVLVVVLCVGGGVLAHRSGRRVAGGPPAWGERAAARLGRVGGALAVLVAGYAVTAVVGLALGFLAKALQSPIDEPAFRWVHARVSDSTFTRGQDKLTLIGNNPIVQLVLLVGGVVLAFAYRRRWWLPVVGLGVAYLAEKYTQRFLAHTVDRGHPPTTLGTYPSGGVGRILAVYGVVVVLVIMLQPGLSRAWRAGLWTGVVTAAGVEAFSRLYLSKHWLTDALFGLPFGTLLMLTNITAVAALASAGRASRPAPAAGTPATERVPG